MRVSKRPLLVHNSGVNRRQHAPRWALWLFVAALLLKSAMPLLANASAKMQGKALVEVCTVYGVSLVPLDGVLNQGSRAWLPAPVLTTIAR